MPASKQFDLNQFLATRTETVNRALDKFLPSEKTKPATIHKAMRYSLFAGGKRMRPALLLAAARRRVVASDAVSHVAARVRRRVHPHLFAHPRRSARDGQRRFPPRQADESQSLRRRHAPCCAGDALLTQAFEITAAQCVKNFRATRTTKSFWRSRKASGSLQLIAGQVADLEGEGKNLSIAELKFIHERKTSALLCCSARLGGMSANCTAAQLRALTDFGYHVGLAFQVIDDILDVTQTSEKLGKTAGK